MIATCTFSVLPLVENSVWSAPTACAKSSIAVGSTCQDWWRVARAAFRGASAANACSPVHAAASARRAPVPARWAGIPADRAARALRAPRAGRLADPDEHAGRNGRGAGRRRDRGGRGDRVAARLAPEGATMSHGHGPPPEQRIRERESQVIDGRDVTRAVGRRGEPGRWRRAAEGAAVRGFRQRFEDGRWSFLYSAGDTRYASTESPDGQVP